jgi:hypothetical protein
MRELSEYITEYVSSGRSGAKLLMDTENITTLDDLVKFLDALGYEQVDMCDLSEMLKSHNGNVYCFNKKYKTLPMGVIVRADNMGDVVYKFNLENNEKTLRNCFKSTLGPSRKGVNQELISIKLALKTLV